MVYSLLNSSQAPMALAVLKCSINRTVRVQASNLGAEPVRKSANYHPCVWGNHFATYTPDYSKVESWSLKAEQLKREARVKLQNMNIGSTEDLVFLDDLQRLGLGYHFEEEIEEVLLRLNKGSFHDGDDLFSISLRFRLLRQGGFHAPSDVFNKFKGGESGFKDEYSSSDVRSLLDLYEAAMLSIPGETIMDEATAFSMKHLQSFLPYLDQHMKTRVQRALNLPPYRSFQLLEFRNFITFYEQEKTRSNLLLDFAKLDFNLVQSSLKTELKDMTKWWNDWELSTKAPSSSIRNRLVELFIWSTYLYHEPHCHRARAMFAKFFVLAGVTDDIYDVYGTIDELQILTDAFDRWDCGTIGKMPEYMQIYYCRFLDTLDDFEKELSKDGYAYRVGYLKEEWKAWTKAYYTEAKWCNSGYRPSYKEYMDVARVTAGFPTIPLSGLLGLGEVVTREALLWLRSRPPIMESCSYFCRIIDDLQEPYKFQYGRDHVDSCVDCYMRENGVTGLEAKLALRKEVDLYWKEINQALLRPRAFPLPILMPMLNLARSAEVYYFHGDNIGDSTGVTRDIITTLLVDPIHV